jgi:hypothetical protein
MEYTFNLICTLPFSGEVDGLSYAVKEGDKLKAQSQSLDKKKWFIFLPEIEKYVYIEKYHFNIEILSSIVYPQFYGEFQLPVLSDMNMYSLVCLSPVGYIVLVNKLDTITRKVYKLPQHLDSSAIRFM